MLHRRHSRPAATDGEAARERRTGFTLIEIMAVVLIMGLLISVVGINIVGRIEGARVQTAKANLSSLETAINFYQMDNARFPTTEQGLDALVEKPTTTPEPRNYPPGGYLKRDSSLMDPWGNPYQYASPGQHNPNAFDVWSFGADGAEGGTGTDADIGNWTPEESEG